MQALVPADHLVAEREPRHHAAFFQPEDGAEAAREKNTLVHDLFSDTSAAVEGSEKAKNTHDKVQDGQQARQNPRRES